MIKNNVKMNDYRSQEVHTLFNDINDSNIKKSKTHIISTDNQVKLWFKVGKRSKIIEST
jgi:hypothetical protein